MMYAKIVIRHRFRAFPAGLADMNSTILIALGLWVATKRKHPLWKYFTNFLLFNALFQHQFVWMPENSEFAGHYVRSSLASGHSTVPTICQRSHILWHGICANTVSTWGVLRIWAVIVKYFQSVRFRPTATHRPYRDSLRCLLCVCKAILLRT